MGHGIGQLTANSSEQKHFTSEADVTVVSALIDIGVIPATRHVSAKDPAKYLKWMEIFKSIKNPVVFFTDNIAVGQQMIELREYQPTVVNTQNYNPLNHALETLQLHS